MLQLVTKPVLFCKIEPSQAKRHIGTEAHRRLIDSIRQHGILQAPGIRPDGPVVWGTGRVLAAIEAGLKEIQVVVLDTPMTEAQYRVLNLTENFIRAELKPIEQVDGVEELARLNPELSNKEIADLLALDPSMVTRLRAVAKCPTARTALAEGKVSGIADGYIVAKAPEEQKATFLAMKLSGATRDQLEQAGRKARATTPPAAKLSRIPVRLPGGVNVVISGNALSLDDVIDHLSEALKSARKARSEGLTAKSWTAAMKDKSKVMD
jgi:ParB family transcriptional regulator, chromosome partitioning protein